MQIETRTLGTPVPPAIEQEVHRAFDAALDCFETRVERVRVRILGGHGEVAATCRVRAWCGRGQTIVIEASGSSYQEAMQLVADGLHHAVRRRWTRERALRQRFH